MYLKHNNTVNDVHLVITYVNNIACQPLIYTQHFRSTQNQLHFLHTSQLEQWNINNDSQCKGKGKQIPVSSNIASLLWKLTCHVGSHSVTCHPAEVTLPPLPELKLVLDLVTPEKCKAELTWWLVKH